MNIVTAFGGQFNADLRDSHVRNEMRRGPVSLSRAAVSSWDWR